MNLTQIIILWLSLGLIAVIMDLTRPEHRKEYKGMNLFHAFGMMILFIAIGGLSFSMALSDYIEYRKRLKRKDEVIEMVNALFQKRTFTRLQQADWDFLWSLNDKDNYGVINDAEYDRLKSIVENYNKTR